MQCRLLQERSMMRPFLLLAVALLVAPTGVTAAEDALASIIERHIAARGGEDAIRAMGSIEMELTIEEPRFTVDARYRATRQGSMRIDIFANDARVYTEAMADGQAWSMGQGDDALAKPETPAGAAALRHGVESPLKLFGLDEMQGRGHQLVLVGRETIDGIDYEVIEATLDDGYRTRYYLNPTTWMIDRERQYRALHVDVNPHPEWIETKFADYRTVGGVRFPFQQIERQLASGTVLVTTTLRRITLNPELDPSMFVAPKPPHD
jgi:hypothetical protein